MAAVLYFADGPLFAAAQAGRGLKWVALALPVTLGFAVYAVAGQLSGAFDLRDLARLLPGRRRRVRP
jgi:hypothetical protein